MKRAAAFFVVFLGVALLSCGGGSGTKHPSRIARRAFVSNTFLGALNIVDINQDRQALARIPSGSSFLAITPTFLTLSDDRTRTLVFDETLNSVAVVTNETEVVNGTISLPNWTESIVISSDAKTAWAAVRNAEVANQPTTGVVAVIDLQVGSVSRQIPIPLARYVFRNHGGTKLLVFGDQSNSAFIIDLAHDNTVTAVPGFNRPVAAIFSSDDSKAYVLSCGAECGGTAANVRVLDLTTNTPGATASVPGATVGVLDGANLYVAGTALPGTVPGATDCAQISCGFVSIVTASTMTVANPAPIRIGDGHHGKMALAGGKIFIGARTCTNLEGVANSGCLSIFDPGSSTAVVPDPNCGRDRNAPALTCGDVTAVEPITGRNVVYLVQGGEVVIYDTTTGALQSLQIDIVGKVFDVKEIDTSPAP